MKWINHKVITLSSIFLATNDIIAAITSTMGSTLPDYIEGYHKGRIPKYHRTLSHWFVPYVIILMLLFSLAKGNIFLSEFNLFNFFFKIDLLSSYIYSLGFWFFFGAFLHIIQDSVTGEIPLLNPLKKDFSLKLFGTGSIYEYLISISLLILFLYKILN